MRQGRGGGATGYAQVSCYTREGNVITLVNKGSFKVTINCTREV